METGGRPETAAAGNRLIGGRYRLVERLGTGGMGTVWAGRDVLVDRDVAVKEAYVADQRAHVERILREARAAARVNHPAVVTVHDVVMEDGHPWIVMERVHGEPLAALLGREKALEEREAARIALAVAEALAAAHACGVLHRDVKPGNVLLGAGGRVVLTDFGIAYIEGEESLTRPGEFLGSLAYTAPERMGGSPPGPASDLWSLGVLLFESVEGWSPFRRETVEGTVGAVLTAETPSPLRAVGLGPLITDLLTKEPGNRPTVEQVVAALRPVVDGGSVSDRVDGAIRTPRTRPVTRRLGLKLAAATTLLALLPLGVSMLRDGIGKPGQGGSAVHSARPSTTPKQSPTSTPAYVRVQEREFGIEVPNGWKRHPKNGNGQYRYTKGEYELIVVPGRDAAQGRHSHDPLVYQRDTEPELAHFRDATWAMSNAIRQRNVAEHAAASGTFIWNIDNKKNVLTENIAILINGRYHVLLTLGPESARDAVSRLQARAVATYTPR